MPFKRAGWLQRFPHLAHSLGKLFQCPLSGLVGCNKTSDEILLDLFGVSMPFKRAGWLQPERNLKKALLWEVSMPFKRAGWLQQQRGRSADGRGHVSMPFKRAGWLQR